MDSIFAELISNICFASGKLFSISNNEENIKVLEETNPEALI